MEKSPFSSRLAGQPALKLPNMASSITGSKTLRQTDIRATTASEKTSEPLYDQKITSSLREKMHLVTDSEKIPVWLWFTDIDMTEIDKLVEKETGLTADNIAIDFGSLPDELLLTLDSLPDKADDEKQHDLIAKSLNEYVQLTSSQREKEKLQTETYLQVRRRMVSEAYAKKNSLMVEVLKLDQKDITFVSQLTPSVIVDLTKAQVLDVAQSAEVVSMGIFDNTTPLPSLVHPYDLSMKAMRGDLATIGSSLSGDGAVVLLHEGNWVRTDNHYSVDIVNPDKIRNVHNMTHYSLADQDILPHDNDWHSTFVAGAMQFAAVNAGIYVVRGGDLYDVEYALAKLGIHVVSVPTHGNPTAGYCNDFYVQWFDAIVSSYLITVVGGGGNSTDDYQHVGTYCAYPAGGYNTIGDGAYRTNGDSADDAMNNKFRYNPIVHNPTEYDAVSGSGDQVCYKPDMVVAAGSTSEATALLPGIIALMIDLKPSLAGNPELIKAILMASCHRKVKPAEIDGGFQEMMKDGLTQRQGAGAIDVYRALGIVAKNQYGKGTIDSDEKTIAKIPRQKDGKYINTSLTWLNEMWASYLPRFEPIPYSVAELDLQVFESYIYSTEPIASSTRRNAGKQMVYFLTPTKDSKSEYCLVKVKRPEGYSPIQPIRYAYAWSTEDTSMFRRLPASVFDRIKRDIQQAEMFERLGFRFD